MLCVGSTERVGGCRGARCRRTCGLAATVSERFLAGWFCRQINNLRKAPVPRSRLNWRRTRIDFGRLANVGRETMITPLVVVTWYPLLASPFSPSVQHSHSHPPQTSTADYYISTICFGVILAIEPRSLREPYATATAVCSASVLVTGEVISPHSACTADGKRTRDPGSTLHCTKVSSLTYRVVSGTSPQCTYGSRRRGR